MSKHANTPARSSAAATKSSRRRRAAKWARVALAAAPVLGAGAVAAPAIAQNQGGSAKYSFETLDNQNDVTFNQLLGINDHGLIAGYFGSGQAGHPEQGLPTVGSLRSGQLSQRELASVSADPGHRPERPRCDRRLLVDHEQHGRHPGERQPRVRLLPRLLP